MRQATLVASVLGALLAPSGVRAEAAVVRRVQVLRDATTTRIVVDIDGDIRFRSRASEDGKALFVDLEDATLDGGVPRLLPVSDKRVDGVLLLGDGDSRVVRVSVDVAGRGRPHVLSRVEGSRLLLDFTDAPVVSADQPSGTASPPGSAAATARPRVAKARGPDARTEAGVPDARELRAAKARALATPAATAQASPEPARPQERSRKSAAVDTAAATGRTAGPVQRRSIVERPVVVLDPGHGGRDPGARAWTGEVEKDIVLDLAERVARRLRARGDLEVVMTRTGDEYVELADRRDASRRWGADVFVSIHANASHNVAARGVETYYHSRTTNDRGMRRLVRAENGGRSGMERPASSSRGAPARSALSKASLSSPSSSPLLDRRPESIRLARAVQGELVRQLGMRYEAVRDLGAKEGPFFVIGDNAAPSVLVEAAFLTHREEGLRMRSEVYREQIADGVARGIVAFLDLQRRAGTL